MNSETETLKFLVHKHLSMSHLAFRRDTSDPAVILQFASDVGSPEVLSMLYVLTCADLSAVGPDVFNDWKGEVLASLYQRTMRQLTGESTAKDDDRLRGKLTRTAHARGARASGSSGNWNTFPVPTCTVPRPRN